MASRLHVATRKGLFKYERIGSGWHHASTAFLGHPVTMMLSSPDNKTIFAALNLGHFGVKVHRSTDEGKTWIELTSPQFPKVEGGEKDDKAPAVSQIWSLE